MNDMFHVFDGDGTWYEYADLEDAKSEAQSFIDNVDPSPEWPDEINHIAIYEAPTGCEYPDEDGLLVYHAAECNVRSADEGSGCDYFCDYRLEKHSATPSRPAQIGDE